MIRHFVFILFLTTYTFGADASNACREVFAEHATATNPTLPETSRQALNDLASLGQDFVRLIQNPAVIQRLRTPVLSFYKNRIVVPSFLDFAKSHLANSPHANPEEVWQAYRQEFGKIYSINPEPPLVRGERALWRALVLTPEQALLLERKEIGLAANSIRAGQTKTEAINRILQEGLESVLKSHLSFGTVGQSPFMSASGDPDFAQWAAQPQKLRSEPNTKIYLVRFKVWDADLVDTGNPKEVLVFDNIDPTSILFVTEAVGTVEYRGRDF